MLAPDDRSYYSDALRPPAGWQLDRAVASTYSLDLTTLLVFPLHLALLEARRTEDALHDGVALLESLRRVSDRLIVFTQQGEVHAPGVPQMLYTLLEPVIHEARSPHPNGALHAKFWMLRFTTDDGATSMLRLVVPTRNITNDRCWDLVLTLEGRPGGRPNGGNRALRQLMEALPGMSRRPLTPEWESAIRELAEEVHRTEWDLPDGFDEIRLHALGLRRREWLPPDSKALAIISPFLSASALEKLIETTDYPAALISRAEDMAQISKPVLKQFRRRLVLNPITDDDVVDEERVTGPAISGLHAKVYIAECSRRTHLLIGSANATAAGLLGLNVEVMVELIGRTSQVGGIEELLGGDGFGSILTEFIIPPEPVQVDANVVAAQRALLQARLELADCGLRVECSQDESGWRSVLVPAKKPSLIGIRTARAWPATRRELVAADVLGLTRGESVAWEPASLAITTGLIAFELEAEDADERARFTLNLPIQGLAEDERDSAILRSVLANREGFLRYLLLLLAEDPDFAAEFLPESEKSASPWVVAADGYPLLEEMTRALERDPGKLRAIGTVMQRLRRQEHDDVVPDEFVKVWQAFETVLGEAAQ